MSNSLGVTINGKHKVGESAAIVVNGVYREAQEIYLVKNGKFIKCYQSTFICLCRGCNKMH